MVAKGMVAGVKGPGAARVALDLENLVRSKFSLWMSSNLLAPAGVHE
jgi:hypothetical protein